MKVYTVSEVAALAGISVRTLHYYDEIGLLKPAHVGDNRYRYYREPELLRLQQILLHRELGMTLNEIGAILDDPHFDYLATLRTQRERLEAEGERCRQLVRTIDRTIGELEGDGIVKHKDLYSGFVPQEKQAEYEAWLVDRFGEDARLPIAASRSRFEATDPGTAGRHMEELEEIETALADAMQANTPPQARSLDPLIGRHRDWVAAMWGKACPADAYATLADIYGAHPDFARRFEAIRPGFSSWLPTAMKAWARRQT
ncbi:MerR family transcriptional regulator [Nitratireductor thuwali]|uniref:HTH-type transcriptional activator mta n=1 Tax=Nitratireductor thuwali TaxID=2267699 RepID=A0ABY5MGS9_9HYPH|nr:HTH-type transcriptional activator mta [Nitratireductor thuwali]